MAANQADGDGDRRDFLSVGSVHEQKNSEIISQAALSGKALNQQYYCVLIDRWMRGRGWMPLDGQAGHLAIQRRPEWRLEIVTSSSAPTTK